MSTQKPLIQRTETGIHFHGFLDESVIPRLRSIAHDVVSQHTGSLTCDFSECDGMKLGVAAAIFDALTDLRRRGMKVEVTGLSPDDETLFDAFERHVQRLSRGSAGWSLRSHFEGVGDDVLGAWATLKGLAGFFRETIRVIATLFRHPSVLRWPLVLYYMEQSGVKAVPIIGVLCWLLGTVLGYQGAYQLKTFAAELFMPDLVGYSITWEIGPLLAGILVAGRSSSAFAAELGTMRVRQEIDALSVMGFDVYAYLVMPKLTALILVMPFLTLMADFFGLLGGLLIGGWYIEMPARYYLDRLSMVLLPLDFYWGMVKSLVFAVIIANVGCYMGITVKGGAAEVGRATTAAVVTSIFLVIVADALISLVYVQIRPTVAF
jgi:phospholipid/cholesterol/gamma-HCH transport system permease protein